MINYSWEEGEGYEIRAPGLTNHSMSSLLVIAPKEGIKQPGKQKERREKAQAHTLGP